MAKIDSFNSGFIVIDGKQYVYDVIILTDGTVKERESDKKRNGSHNISAKEIANLHNLSADASLIGIGASGNAKLEDAAMSYLINFNFKPIILPTSLAVEKFNQLTGEGKRVAALIHITC
jgi:hypothetical protein